MYHEEFEQGIEWLHPVFAGDRLHGKAFVSRKAENNARFLRKNGKKE